MNWVKKTIFGIIIVTLLGAIGNYFYAYVVFHITMDTEFYTNPETGETIVNLMFYNNGYRTIKELDFIINDNCGLNLQRPKIIYGESENCKLKDYFFPSGTCNKFSVGDILEIKLKGFKKPTMNCSIKLSYDLDWPGLFFRLSASDKLKESGYTITYDDTAVTRLPINFSFTSKPLRSFFYNGGRALVYSNILSNKTQQYRLTGEWFNSSILYDASTYIENSAFNETFEIEERGEKDYYHWIIMHPPEDVSEIGFMGTLRDSEGNVYQEKVPASIIKKDDLLPYLRRDENIKFDDNSTFFALSSVKGLANSDDLSQATALLEVVRGRVSVPKEVSKIVYFEENNIDSLNVFYEKEGTSSEFSSLYIMFLRSIGIPAKMEYYNKDGVDYYYTSVFINEREWSPVDVYDINKKFGECITNCSNEQLILL